MTLLDIPVSTSRAQRLASANFIANRAALVVTQPSFSQTLLPPREQVEWVFGRDGTLTARDEQGDWWSGCSLPHAAGEAMFKKMDVTAPVACFLAPPHAAHLKIALDKLAPEQAVIAVVPEEADIRLLLTCGDFSKDITNHRLWIAPGPAWSQTMESILDDHIGLAVPGQFLRLQSTDEELLQSLIHDATEVFSRITNHRSQKIADLNQGAGSSLRHPRRICVMTPMRFRLWHDEGRVLSQIAPADSVRLETSDPSQSSPLKLATAACEAGALLAPNFARADLPGVLPMDVPWLTWITNDRIPRFDLAGPNDRLLVAGDSVCAAAIAAGWPADRLQIANWPRVELPAAKGKRELTILADTSIASTPADLEGFSSHRVLWETILNELAKDPFSLDGDPGLFLASRMRRFDVSADAFPHERFLTQLIVPAYQQSVVRAMLKARLPVKLVGFGWSDIEEFAANAAGIVESPEEVESALTNATVLVDVWPWRSAHPICAVNRPVVRREGRSLSSFIHRARNVLANGAISAGSTATTLSADVVTDLLISIHEHVVSGACEAPR